jgi:hypothetical protein
VGVKLISQWLRRGYALIALPLVEHVNSLRIDNEERKAALIRCVSNDLVDVFIA